MRGPMLLMQLVLLPLLFFLGYLVGSGQCQGPAVLRIGAVFTYNSVIGRVAKPALEAAVYDVNSDPSIMNRTKLELVLKDADCNAFFGAIEAFQVLEKEVVAIIGPQSSAVAHMMSAIANGLHVPVISYAATDPTLASLQFPFFLQTAPSDSYQMSAMAELISFYGWRDVIAIFVDNEYGRNAILVLEDELEKKMMKLPTKVVLPEQFDVNIVTDLLNQSKMLGPRVYVLHLNPDPSFRIFGVAKELGMMSRNYVWLATDWFSATLDSLAPVNHSLSSMLEGVVSLRQHMPASRKKKSFMSRWRTMQQKGLSVYGVNAYGFLAYDTVWTVARSIGELLNENKTTFSFSNQNQTVNVGSSEMYLNSLKSFDGGDRLLKKLTRTIISGISGQVEFKSGRNVLSGGYEVINVRENKVDVVGYWSLSSGLSESSPETLKNRTSRSNLIQNLGPVIWPGGEVVKPPGWVATNNGKPLRVGVPRRVSFVEFVHDNSSKVEGYCIDIFNEARKFVPYDVPYTFELFGNGHSNPSYNELVKKVADNEFDAAVGDIAIVTKRTRVVDFTQPYAASGLVIVVLVDNEKSNTWVFLKPFTLELWCATAASFVFTGAAVWILEHRKNDDFRGPPGRQIMTVFIFICSTLFKSNKERMMSSLGRLVMIVWLFLLMVITASYTASLTSILTVEKLSSPIKGIDSLLTSNLPIGYQVGSFADNYLRDELLISRSRLVALGGPEAYESALRKGPAHGGVAAVIDERPYVELFLSNRTDFAIVGEAFTKGGWGFAFKRESLLAVDFSTAILKLSENGKLQKIHDKWFCELGCPGARGGESDSDNEINSFMGLYKLCGIVILVALVVFLLRVAWLFNRYRRKQNEAASSTSESSSSSSTTTKFFHLFYKFLKFIDQKEEAIKHLFSSKSNHPHDHQPAEGS